MSEPIAVDLFCGLGGWTEGLLAAGYKVVGFDLERHEYGEHRYPAQLVLQDVLTLHGRQFKDSALIVASPPCQRYSWMAMPWKKSKAKAAWYREEPTRVAELNALFDACFRIQREACEGAGRFIPLVVENVVGAQPWVGRARYHFGSYYLWGDVPALMPTPRRANKVPGFRFDGSGRSFQTASVEGVKVPGLNWSSEDKAKRGCFRDSAIKNNGGSWFAVAHNTTSWHGRNPDGRLDGIKNGGRAFPNEHADRGLKQGGSWFHDSNGTLRSHSSKSPKRKAASAMIAKIPFPLAHWIARAWHPAGLR